MTKNFVRIDGWPVAPAVARDYLRMRAAHDAATGGALRINSGYRTRSEQAAIFESRYAPGVRSPYGDYRTYKGITWGRISGAGPVASPDVGSNHTRGYALDLNVSAGSASQRWLLAHAAEYGFNWHEGKSVGEPWHWCWHVAIFPARATPDPWEGRGAPDPVFPSDPGLSLDDLGGRGGGSINPDLFKEDEMSKLYRIQDKQSSRDGTHYAIGDGSIVAIEKRDVKMARDAGAGREKSVREASFKALLRRFGIPEGVVDGQGRILDDQGGQGQHVRLGSWFRSDKAERFAWLAQR